MPDQRMYSIDPLNPYVEHEAEAIRRGLEWFFQPGPGVENAPQGGSRPSGSPIPVPGGGGGDLSRGEAPYYLQRPPAPLPDFELSMPQYDPGPGPLTIPAPPAREANPAFAAREEYLGGREGRLRDLMAGRLEAMKADDPAGRPWWERLAEIGGRIAADGSLANAGVVTADYFGDERAYRERIQDALLQYGLGQEDLGMETAEAGFARQGAEHEAASGTREDEYRTGVVNTQNQYENSLRQSEGRNQFAIAGADVASRQALMEYERQMAVLNALGQMGGEGGLGAAESMFSGLDPRLQEGAQNTLEMSGLASLIQQEMMNAGDNAGRAVRNVHQRMEGLAGRQLERPPRTMQDPVALARWYADQGVPLGHEAVRRSFPGIGAPE